MLVCLEITSQARNPNWVRCFLANGSSIEERGGKLFACKEV